MTKLQLYPLSIEHTEFGNKKWTRGQRYLCLLTFGKVIIDLIRSIFIVVVFPLYVNAYKQIGIEETDLMMECFSFLMMSLLSVKRMVW